MTIQDKLDHPQFKPILIDGKLYLAGAEAARAKGCTSANITYKLKSLNHPTYQYITKEDAVMYLQTLSILKSSETHPTIKMDVAV